MKNSPVGTGPSGSSGLEGNSILLGWKSRSSTGQARAGSGGLRGRDGPAQRSLTSYWAVRFTVGEEGEQSIQSESPPGKA